MALFDYVVDCSVNLVGKSRAVMHAVEVGLCQACIASGANQQLGSVEQCLGITVYTKVVVEVKVAVGSLVLVVLRLCDVLAEEVTSVLVTVLVSTVCIGVEACNVAALVAFGIPLEGLKTYGSESPAVSNATVVAGIGCPGARAYKAWKNRSAGNKR